MKEDKRYYIAGRVNVTDLTTFYTLSIQILMNGQSTRRSACRMISHIHVSVLRGRVSV